MSTSTRVSRACAHVTAVIPSSASVNRRHCLTKGLQAPCHAAVAQTEAPQLAQIDDIVPVHFGQACLVVQERMLKSVNFFDQRIMRVSIPDILFAPHALALAVETLRSIPA